jgi:electron transfer flavoprotein beta subunit
MGIVVRQSFLNLISIGIAFLIGAVNTLYLYPTFLGSKLQGLIIALLAISNLVQPFISFGTKMEVNENIATINRDIEGGEEVVEVATPFVLSAAKGMAEQRIPNMRGIMMAKRKPLSVIEPVAFDDPVAVVGYTLPSAKSAVKMVDPEDMDELVRLLHEEAKII